MTIIVFLVDTSASMNQRTYMGTTMLDVAKGAVETFMKIRSRDPNSRWDRYMLLTFEDPPANVKAGWKENHATFMKELKNLEALGLSTLGPALKHTFDLLNINRMTSGIDTYGQGRCPFYLEPAIIICFTDGSKMTTMTSASYALNLPMNTAVPGSELTKEPFRWDQRLFGVVLRMAATPPVDVFTYIPSADDTAIHAMCEVTGGRSYAISSQRTLIQCLESLVQKCQSGVVVSFEKLPNEGPLYANENEKNGEKRPASPSGQDQAWQNCRRLIYVPRSAQKGYTVGHWPIPESFWPDLNSPSLPPRLSHPVLKFSCNSCEPVVLDNLPFDKYELEPSPLTQYILERRQPNVAWQVFIAGSAKYNDIGLPFGYLKASTSLSSVNLFVMPYNYPQLVPLLDELFKVHKCKPPPKWRQQFDAYLKTMPVYYAAPLKRALARMGAPTNLIPEQIENCLSYAVVSYLKKLKNQAKLEYDRLVASVGQCLPVCQGIKVMSRSQTSILERADFNQLLAHHRGDLSSLKQELKDWDTLMLHVETRNPATRAYTNPFDIKRNDLLNQIVRMRVNFMKMPKLGTSYLREEENLHTISVQDMGNYQEYLKKLPQPLREIETLPVRQHTFGNPFKVNKNIMIDEADEAMPGQPTGRKRPAPDSPASSPRPNKRKPGPLPRDVPVRELLSPVPMSPPSSPDSLEPTVQLYLPGPASIGESGDESADNMTPNHVHSCLDNLTNHVQDVVNSELNGGLEIDLTLDDEGVTNGETEISSLSNNRKPNNFVNSVKIQECNANLQKLAIVEVRKPGKRYDNIFKHLRLLQGTTELRCHFIRNVQGEAARFKKQALVSQLEEFMRSQATNSVQSASKQKLSGATEMSKIRVSNKCNDDFGGFH